METMSTATETQAANDSGQNVPVVKPLRVRLIGYREGVHTGNINWGTAHPMVWGKFPRTHPVGGEFCDNPDGQCGTSEAMTAFRDRGYWASCFPEGDGITWRPLRGQDLKQTANDVRECFGWDVSV